MAKMLTGVTRASRLLVGGAVAAAALFGAAAPANALLKFNQPQALTDPQGGDAFRPHVTEDNQGRATLAWTIDPTGPCANGTCRQIQTVRLSASGTPGAVHSLSSSTEDAYESEAQVAVDSQGQATVVWEESDAAGDTRIEAVRIAADGTPGLAQTLSPPGADAVYPKVAIDSLGQATVVWYQQNLPDPTFRIGAVRIAADGTLGTVRTLSPPVGGDAADPSLAVDSQDRVTVVWTQYDGTQYRAEQVRLDGAGNPGSVQTLSAPGGNVSLPQVAVDSQGRARVVWDWNPTVFGGGANVLQTALLDPAETEGPVQSLASGYGVGSAELAFDSRDLARVVWQDSSPARTRTVAAGGSLGAAQALFHPVGGSSETDPEIAFDSHDRAVIAFVASDGVHDRIRVVRLASDGTRGALQTLGAAGRDAGHPQLAIDSQDRVTVAWDSKYAGSTYSLPNLRVEVALAQTAPPDTKITHGPRNRSAIVSPGVKLSFTGAPGVFVGSFQCSVDARPFKTCSSPLRLNGIRDGRHTVRVRAIDQDGPDATPAVRRFVEIGSCIARAKKAHRLPGARQRCRRRFS